MPFRGPSARSGHPGRQGPVSRASTCSTGRPVGRRSPPASFWPGSTRIPRCQFFTAAEQATAGPCSTCSWPSTTSPKVPVLALVDRRLAAARPTAGSTTTCPRTATPGARAWPLSTRTPTRSHGERFHRLASEQQAALVQAVHDADTVARLPAAHVWSLWTRYACTAFYSHPWAWNEIGFGGPAYPAGLQGSRRRQARRLGGRRPPRCRPGALGRAGRASHSAVTPAAAGTGAAQLVSRFSDATDRAATSRPGCCPTATTAPTIGCAATCAASPTTTRSTW